MTDTIEPVPARIDQQQLAQDLVESARAEGVELVGPGGLLTGLTKTVLETALEAEISEHLGYDKHGVEGRDGGNSRNGTRTKTVLTEIGPVEIEVPRDRDASFEPVIVRKRQRRLDGIDEVVLSLTARGLTTGEVAAHFDEVYGAKVSRDTISRITDKVLEEMTEWQHRPLDAVYPVLFVDAIHVKVRDGQVTNRPFYVVIGVTVTGERDILGIWAGDGAEGARFWLQVFSKLKNRGVEDVLIAVCDGLKGLPEAIEATWPDSMVQTCVVHLIRAAMRFVAYQDRKKVAAALKPIYTAPNEETARKALAEFEASELGTKYPSAAATWANSWERFIPFLQFPPMLRKVIYTTNSIESLNFQLRKVTKNRGHFPSTEAAVKLLWLAICNIEDKRAAERARDRGKPAGQRKAQGRLVEGQAVTNWKQALAQLAAAYPDRINPYL